jgi:hypothetical protein
MICMAGNVLAGSGCMGSGHVGTVWELGKKTVRKEILPPGSSLDLRA